MKGTSVEDRKQAHSLLSCIEGKYCGEKQRQESTPERLVIPCRCKSHWCGECAPRAAYEYRDKLRPVVAQWREVLMVTLTVDPAKFPEGPESAWRYVGKVRAVSVLTRALRRLDVLDGPEWFSTLELHRSGWPHWHVALRARFIAKAKIDAAWKVGGTWIERGERYEPAHAMNYLTKYLTKTEAEPPEWVLSTKANVRRFSTSRGLLEPRKRRRWQPGESVRQHAKRSNAERVAECGTWEKELRRIVGRWVVMDTRPRNQAVSRPESPEGASQRALSLQAEGRSESPNGASQPALSPSPEN